VLLEVEDLCVEYLGPTATKAVDHVSFSLVEGEFLAIVGESGCGKSTLLFAMAQLLSPPAEVTDGAVRFRGRDLVGLEERHLREIRWRRISVVMQSAMNALNPVKSVGAQFADAMRAHGERDRAVIGRRSEEVLHLVGIDPTHLRSYPHQLSGGMRQRLMIAMALLFSPQLVLMDEPTSALDVVAQRSLMLQIKELQRHLGFAVVFVTHDMSLVSNFSDRLAVMYAGEVVELGPTTAVFDHPLHPYTQGLLEAFPSVHGPKVPLTGIGGTPPDLSDIPTGCPFHPRCPARVGPVCDTAEPQRHRVGSTEVRCHLYSSERSGAA
jgi:peptide/nickel transport system ATP-binding protein